MLLLFCFLILSLWGDDSVHSLPDYGNLEVPSYAGYAPVNATHGSNVFYWFLGAEGSKSDTTSISKTPLILWLNGGPGASSLTGQFTEMGPIQLSSDGKLQKNPHAWTTLYHMIFFDNPVGTGYSYTDNTGYVKTEKTMAVELVQALRHFYELHPEYVSCDLYITGESYAGKYLPHIAAEIISQNNQHIKQNIPLSGVGLGNGWMNPWTQQSVLPDYYFNLGMINEKQKQKAEKRISECKRIIETEDWKKASKFCDPLANNLAHDAGDVFVYDIRNKDNTFFDKIGKYLGAYLNRPDVKNIFHVGNHTWTDVDGTGPVNDNLALDLMKNNTVELFPYILENNVRLMVYVGNFDGSDCGVLSSKAMIKELIWNEKSEYDTSKRITWKSLDGLAGGYVKQAPSTNFTFTIVHDAGHLVPTNQPLASLDMMNRFITNIPWDQANQNMEILNFLKKIKNLQK